MSIDSTAELVNVNSSASLHFIISGFLARYPQRTRDVYRGHLKQWIHYLVAHGVDPLTVKRAHIEAWALVASSTGCRRGEVLALRWSHVRLDVGEIVVEQALDPVDGHEKATKTHGTRVIAVGPSVVDALRLWRVAMAERALASVGTLVRDPFVFSDALDGSRPWRPDTATKRFGRFRDQAGIDGVRQHDLRHYVATTLLAANIDAKSVAGRMGHTRVATTNDLYARATPARDRAAADVLTIDIPVVR